MEKDEEIIQGSGNIFADLGLPDAEEHLLKAEIVSNIHSLIEQRGFSEGDAAARLRISPLELRMMLRGHFRQYTLDQLLRMVNALGSNVQIVISTRETTDEKARLSVVAA